MSLLQGIQFALGKSEFNAERSKIYADLAEAILDRESLQSILQKRIIRAAQKKRDIALVYRKWLSGMATGKGLAESAKDDIEPFDYMVLSTFERSGRLAEGMQFLAACIGKLKDAKTLMRKALIGPSIVMLLAIAMITGFAFEVVPMISNIYPPERWPALGKALYFVSSIIKNYGLFIAFFIVSLTIGIIYSLPRLTGPIRQKLDKWPFYSSYRRVNGLTTLVGLASQLKVGVSLVESIRLISIYNTPYMRWKLNMVARNLAKSPDEYGRAFDVGLFDDEILYRLMDYSERSSFPRAVEVVGLQSFDAVVVGIKDSADVAGGVAKAVAGAIITFVIVSFLFTAQGIRKDVQDQMMSQQR